MVGWEGSGFGMMVADEIVDSVTQMGQERTGPGRKGV
jgi:hypothetical protein